MTRDESRETGTSEVGRAEHADRVRPASLSIALRCRTAELHTQAERSGIVREILRGQATRRGYALLMRNLLPVYRCMEQGFERHRGTRLLGSFARPAMYRASALEQDLVRLVPNWKRALPLLSEGEAYAARIEQVVRGRDARLIAHAYARYMGDLSGGQIMKRLLRRSLALEAQALTFYDFPCIPDHAAFKIEFRQAVDRAGERILNIDAVVEEGAVAFDHNIAISRAVLAAAA